MRTTLNISLIAFACGAAFCQSAAAPTFDAVSVKLAPPPDGRGQRVAFFGGPGTKTPDRVNVENYGMMALISRAYGVELYQVTGPDWLGDYRGPKYNIVATVPPGTTEQQFRTMMQNLLAERFHLTLHKEIKELPTYSLSIAKSGPKLKNAEPDPPVDPNAPPDSRESDFHPLSKDPDGFPILSGGTTMAVVGDHARMKNKGHMDFLVRQLAAQLRQPVADNTGLTGEYEFSLSWVARPIGSDLSTAEDPAGPDLFAALQEQLGLKLERKKGPVEVLVVDRVEKTPAAN